MKKLGKKEGNHPSKQSAVLSGLAGIAFAAMLIFAVLWNVDKKQEQKAKQKEPIEIEAKTQIESPRNTVFPTLQEIDTVRLVTVVLTDSYSKDVTILRMSSYNELEALETTKNRLPKGTEVEILYVSESIFTNNINPDL